jgi:bifunctional UDP-N-acetylglucosamine pyrophosphorylase/glucosamine-1-phosphate N-acetyltransferase
MKSDIPKVLHPLCEKPMLAHVLAALEPLGLARTLVVLGNGAELVREILPDGVEWVRQEEQLGTAHAVMAAAPALGPGDENLLVMPGDTPLLRTPVLGELLERHAQEAADLTILTMVLPDPTGYGRVVRGPGGEVLRVVEETDASAEERGLHEVNSSIYVFRREPLLAALQQVGKGNAQGEYYLTDVISAVREAGGKLAAVTAPDPEDVLGINSRAQLAEAAALMRGRINRYWMDEGVTLEDPALTYIGAGVRIGRDTVILPLTFLQGATDIGSNCRIGPSTRIVDSRVEDGAGVQESVLRECRIGEGATVGPYASVRPGTVLGPGAKLGTFVEVKKSRVGRGSKIPHLSYIGDAEIGEDANIGAGTITCNYDGEAKHPTVIEDEAFIGSDTMLVAPVRVGRRAVTAAGSAITKDVPEDALGIERSQQKNIRGWRRRKGKHEGDNS